MAKIVGVIQAPLNSVQSSDLLATQLASERGVYCFSGYNDLTHHECAFVTDALTEDEYYSTYLK